MSMYLAPLRRGHLELLINLDTLTRIPEWKICFDPQHPAIDERFFDAHDWYDLYRDASEVISADECRDADEADRRSQTGI